MTLDTPERVKYFGLRSVRTCGTCRLRRGRSVTRRATRHDANELSISLSQANAIARTRPTITNRKRVRDQLSRHGWNYKRKCRLHDHAKTILVNIPHAGVTPPYGGLIKYDALHVYFLNYCTYALEDLAQCVPKQNYTAVRRLVKACHQFRYMFLSHMCVFIHHMYVHRDPETGATHPRLQCVLQMTHLTAERRVRAIFYWAHVLGPSATLLVPSTRRHAQVVVSTLQVILIAMRGHRAYTQRELTYIYGDIATQFFRHLEYLHQELEVIRMRRGREAHRRQPDRNAEPVSFQKQKR